MEFKAARCPSCKGELQVPVDKDSVKCMYCGIDIQVNQVLAESTSGRIPQLLHVAKAALEAENYEDAGVEFNKILELDSNNYDAWVGKGIAMGHLAEKMKDAEVAFRHALSIDPLRKAEIGVMLKSARVFQVKALKDKARETLARAKVHLESSTFDYERKDGEFLLNEMRRAEAKRIAEKSALAKGKPDYLLALKFVDAALDLLPIDLDCWAMREEILIAFEEPLKMSETYQKGLAFAEESLKTSPKDIKFLEAKLLAAKALKYSTVVESVRLEIATIDPNHPSLKATSKDMCFIATAAYPTPFAPEVVFLRSWRDAHCQKHIGKMFVWSYYQVSPPIAKWIGKSEVRKHLTRQVLGKVVAFLKNHGSLTKTGPSSII